MIVAYEGNNEVLIWELENDKKYRKEYFEGEHSRDVDDYDRFEYNGDMVISNKLKVRTY